MQQGEPTVKTDISTDVSVKHTKNPSASGSFVFKVTKNNELLIMHLPAPNVTQINKIWVAAFEKDISNVSFPEKINDATLEVYQDKRSLIIQSSAGIIFVALDEIDNIEKSKLINSPIGSSNVTTAFCYGITFQWGHYDLKKLLDNTSSSAFDRIMAAYTIENHTTNSLLAGGEKCSSGGTGSTECSIEAAFGLGGCSVSCTTGYYACCKASSVTCVCEKSKGTPEN